MDYPRKRSNALLISAILGAAYSFFLMSYFGGSVVDASSSAEMMGGALAMALVMPHMVCVILATIFNFIGWAGSGRGFALAGGILYAVAAVLFFLYAMFVVPSIVLSFVGYAGLGKRTRQELEYTN